MIKKKMSIMPHRNGRSMGMLEIKLPVLSDEAAAAVTDVLVQLHHRFEAAYYAQILSHHAANSDQECVISANGTGDKKRDAEPELF